MKTINSMPRFGDRSEDVKIVQQILAAAGSPSLVIDGIFGNKTLKAVKKFQEKNKLEIDGIIGKNTLKAMGLELKIIAHDTGITAQDIIKQFVTVAENYQGQTEINGPNRSPFIDIVNKWIGESLGAPYCISSICYVLDKIKNSMGVKFDLPVTSSTQHFWYSTKNEYKTKFPQYGNICIFYNPNDEGHGHACIALGPPDANGTFKTFEFNTVKDGKEGVFYSERNINGTPELRMRGFIDVSKSLKFSAENSVFVPNQGSYTNPDWNYIAKNIALDAEIYKLEYLTNICNKIIQNIAKFQTVEAATNVPWKLIASIFFMESSLDFSKNFLNGQNLNQKTTIVPIGRGPWDTFEESAIEGLQGVAGRSNDYWTFGNQLAFAEQYNGIGYRTKNMYSTYVTSYTNFSQEKGKYVRDHVFDPEKLITRPGVAAIILMLNKMNY